MATAWMRALDRDEWPLEVVPLDNPETICVNVPGFGHLLVHPDRLTGLLAKGPDRGERHVDVVPGPDGTMIVAMLHNHDRLDVHIRP